MVTTKVADLAIKFGAESRHIRTLCKKNKISLLENGLTILNYDIQRLTVIVGKWKLSRKLAENRGRILKAQDDLMKAVRENTKLGTIAIESLDEQINNLRKEINYDINQEEED